MLVLGSAGCKMAKEVVLSSQRGISRNDGVTESAHFVFLIAILSNVPLRFLCLTSDACAPMRLSVQMTSLCQAFLSAGELLSLQPQLHIGM